MLNSSEILRDVIQCISIERIAVAEKVLRRVSWWYRKTSMISPITLKSLRILFIFCVFIIWHFSPGDSCPPYAQQHKGGAWCSVPLRFAEQTEGCDEYQWHHQVQSVRGMLFHLEMKSSQIYRLDHWRLCSVYLFCVYTVDSEGVSGVSCISWLLCQQRFNLSDAWGTDWRWCFGQVLTSCTYLCHFYIQNSHKYVNWK